MSPAKSASTPSHSRSVVSFNGNVKSAASFQISHLNSSARFTICKICDHCWNACHFTQPHKSDFRLIWQPSAHMYQLNISRGSQQLTVLMCLRAAIQRTTSIVVRLETIFQSCIAAPTLTLYLSRRPTSTAALRCQCFFQRVRERRRPLLPA
jgi:hypothetical protein